MEIALIDKLLTEGEGLKIEFKEAKDSVPSSFFETVVSFSNTDGGTILLGVNDNGDITGIDVNSESKLNKDIITSLNSPDCINPPIYVEPILVQHAEGPILVIQLPSSSQVHDHAGRIYIREYESDIDITDNQERVSQLYFNKKNLFSESLIYPKMTMDDLDPELFKKARDIIRSYRSDHPWLIADNELMLRESVLFRKDFRTGEEGLTLAAALIFGKDTTIQNLLTAYKIEAIVRIQNIDRWDDRLTLRKNLIYSYLELKNFIYRHLPEKFYQENDQRIDLRDKIFREVIGNVIIHREYLSPLSSDIVITKDSVIITNPNKVHFHGVIDPLSFNPYPKNPNIRKFFTALGWADEIGSGVRNTNKYLPLYSNNAKPVFIENETFRTIVPLLSILFSEFSNEFSKWLELPEKVIEHLQEGLKNVQLSTSLSGKNWEDVILQLIRSWNEKGSKLEVLDWPKKQIVTEEEIKKIPSWSEKGTNLIHKKIRYLIGILALSAKAIPLGDLMDFLEYSNRKTFRENYLNPLESLKLLTKTNPDKPNDPDQKYLLTETGKSFLGGLEI